MRRRKIDTGNAEAVIQRGRNVTIVPFQQEDIGVDGGELRKSAALRYFALDIVNGTAAPNPENISVNLETFPGWKIEEYNCVTGGGGCPNLPAETTYVEVTDNTDVAWVDAYLVVEFVHASGAASDEKLFQVTSATIESDIEAITPANITYSVSTGNVVNSVGKYIWHIATTDSDDKRIMLMELRGPEDYHLMFDEDYIASARRSSGEAHIVRIDGAFRPEDHYNTLTGSTGVTGSYFNYILEAV